MAEIFGALGGARRGAQPKEGFEHAATAAMSGMMSALPLDAFGGRKPENMFEVWLSMFPTAPLFGVRWAMLDMMRGSAAFEAATGARGGGDPAKQDERARRERAALNMTGRPSATLTRPVGGGDGLRVVAGRDAASTDDLTRIKGVGPKLAELLKAQGVTRLAQIAKMDAAAFKALDPKLGTFKGRWKRDKWAEQARKLTR